MSVFLVDPRLPALTSANFLAVHRALVEAARRLTAEGVQVEYVRSIYVPSREQLLCVFHAESAQVVARTNEIAQVPFTRIEEALESPAALRH
jgi:hypothetical protein